MSVECECEFGWTCPACRERGGYRTGETAPTSDPRLVAPTSIRLALQAERGEDGMWRPKAPFDVPIVYDSTLDGPGMVENAYGHTQIILREWNEQVLLHEVLHILLGSLIPARVGDEFGHLSLTPVEASLFHAGWRFRPEEAR